MLNDLPRPERIAACFTESVAGHDALASSIRAYGTDRFAEGEKAERDRILGALAGLFDAIAKYPLADEIRQLMTNR